MANMNPYTGMTGIEPMRYGMAGSMIPSPMGNSPRARLNNYGIASSPTYAGQRVAPSVNPAFGAAGRVNTMGAGAMGNGVALGGSAFNQHVGTGVAPGHAPAMNPVDQMRMQGGPSAADIQAEMARRQVGAQIGQNPGNAVVAGYMMGR